MQKGYSFEYLEYDNFDLLSDEDRSLLVEAIEATKGAYAPYSNFCVGAAILMENGIVVRGSNQENAAYPSGLCAERTAAFYANATYPNINMKAIAIVAANDGELIDSMFYPCGACRQALLEYEIKGKSNIKVIVANKSKVNVFQSIKDLLPFYFDL